MERTRAPLSSMDASNFRSSLRLFLLPPGKIMPSPTRPHNSRGIAATLIGKLKGLASKLFAASPIRHIRPETRDSNAASFPQIPPHTNREPPQLGSITSIPDPPPAYSVTPSVPIALSEMDVGDVDPRQSQSEPPHPARPLRRSTRFIREPHPPSLTTDNASSQPLHTRARYAKLSLGPPAIRPANYRPNSRPIHPHTRSLRPSTRRSSVQSDEYTSHSVSSNYPSDSRITCASSYSISRTRRLRPARSHIQNRPLKSIPPYRSASASQQQDRHLGRHAKSRSFRLSWTCDSTASPLRSQAHCAEKKASRASDSLSAYAFESITLSDIAPDDVPNLLVDTGQLNNTFRVWVGN